MREPLAPGSREAGGVRGVAWQRASAAVGVRWGKGCYFVSGEGALLPGDRKRKPCCLVTGGGESSVARRPEETLSSRDRRRKIPLLLSNQKRDLLPSGVGVSLLLGSQRGSLLPTDKGRGVPLLRGDDHKTLSLGMWWGWSSVAR